MTLWGAYVVVVVAALTGVEVVGALGIGWLYDGLNAVGVGGGEGCGRWEMGVHIVAVWAGRGCCVDGQRWCGCGSCGCVWCGCSSCCCVGFILQKLERKQNTCKQ